jgi:hypothetical protein
MRRTARAAAAAVLLKKHPKQFDDHIPAGRMDKEKGWLDSEAMQAELGAAVELRTRRDGHGSQNCPALTEVEVLARDREERRFATSQQIVTKIANRKTGLETTVVKSDAKLTVATYNMFSYTYNMLEYLRAMQQDVLCLQETHGTTGAELTTLLGAEIVFTGDDPKPHSKDKKDGDPGSGVAILLSERVRKSVNDHGHVGSRIVWVQLQVEKWDRPLIIVSVYIPYCGHKNPTPAHTIQELDQLLERKQFQSAEVLVCGDWNCQLGRKLPGCTGRWCVRDRTPSRYAAMAADICGLMRRHHLRALETDFEPAKWGDRATYTIPTGTDQNGKDLNAQTKVTPGESRVQLDYTAGTPHMQSIVSKPRVYRAPETFRFAGKRRDHVMLSLTFSLAPLRTKITPRQGWPTLTKNKLKAQRFAEEGATQAVHLPQADLRTRSRVPPAVATPDVVATPVTLAALQAASNPAWDRYGHAGHCECPACKAAKAMRDRSPAASPLGSPVHMEFLNEEARRAQKHADKTCNGSQHCALCHEYQQWKEVDPHRPLLTATGSLQGFGDVDLDFQTATAPPAGPMGSVQATSYAEARRIESDEAVLAETDIILAEPDNVARVLAFAPPGAESPVPASPVSALRARRTPDSSTAARQLDPPAEPANSASANLPVEPDWQALLALRTGRLVKFEAQDEILMIPVRMTDHRALRTIRHQETADAKQLAQTEALQDWRLTQLTMPAAGEPATGEVSDADMEDGERERDSHSDWGSDRGAEVIQPPLATSRQLRTRTPGLDMNEDTLAHAALVGGLALEPPDEQAIARLVEIRPSAGKGAGLFTGPAGLPKGTPIYYWGDIIDGREHRRRYASAPGQYVMVWQALEASCSCSKSGSSPCPCDLGVYVDAIASKSWARYVNHSATPNMEIKHQAFNGVNLQTWPALVTTQAIPGNTELELDYGDDFAIPPQDFASSPQESWQCQQCNVYNDMDADCCQACASAVVDRLPVHARVTWSGAPQEHLRVPVQTVHTVHLQPGRYTDDQAAILAQHVEQATNLRALCADGSMMALSGWQRVLSQAMNTALTDLVVTHTPLGRAGAQCVVDAVDPACIQVLDLTDTGLDAVAVDTITRSLSLRALSQTAALNKPKGDWATLLPLRLLNLSCNLLADEGAAAVSRLIGHLLHLETLQLAGTRLTSAGAREILREAPATLTHLDLSDATLHSDDLASALHHLPLLVRLDVEDTVIEGSNTQLEQLAVALCLSADAALRTLYLGDQQCSAWAAQARQHMNLTVYPDAMSAEDAVDDDDEDDDDDDESNEEDDEDDLRAGSSVSISDFVGGVLEGKDEAISKADRSWRREHEDYHVPRTQSVIIQQLSHELSETELRELGQQLLQMATNALNVLARGGPSGGKSKRKQWSNNSREGESTTSVDVDANSILAYSVQAFCHLATRRVFREHQLRGGLPMTVVLLLFEVLSSGSSSSGAMGIGVSVRARHAAGVTLVKMLSLGDDNRALYSTTEASVVAAGTQAAHKYLQAAFMCHAVEKLLLVLHLFDTSTAASAVDAGIGDKIRSSSRSSSSSRNSDGALVCVPGKIG